MEQTIHRKVLQPEVNDLELVRRVNIHSCNESYKALVEKHSPLFNKMFSRYENALRQKGLGREDFFQEKDYLFFKAISSFQENKNIKFHTWLGNQVKYHCLRYLNDKKILNCIREEVEIVDNNEDAFNEPIPPKLLSELINEFEEPALKQVFHLRYGQEKLMRWKDIAKEVGSSITWCMVLHKKGITILKENLKNRGLI